MSRGRARYSPEYWETSPAWLAIRGALWDGEPHTRLELIDALIQATDCEWQSAKNILQAAQLAGMVRVVGKDAKGRPIVVLPSREVSGA